jgi:GNAT superfamily N-acetyltransferase
LASYIASTVQQLASRIYRLTAAPKPSTITTMSDFLIRPATTGDIPALLALVEQSVRQLHLHHHSPSQIEASIGSAFGIDRQLIADSTYFVATPATDPTTLVACGGWSFRSTLCGSDSLSNRDPTTLSPATDFAKIRAIFVHPAWARRGLGSLLLAYCESAAHAAGFTRFEMGSTLAGVPLYTLKGYIEQRRTYLDLPNGEHLPIVVMNKSL